MEVQASKLDAELSKVKGKLTLAQTTLKKLNTGSHKLDEILNLSKPLKAGIGFQESLNSITSSLSSNESDACFVKESFYDKNSFSKESSDIGRVCQYCHTHGHFKNKCNAIGKNKSSSSVLPEVLPSTPDNTLCQRTKSKKKCGNLKLI